MGFFGKLFGSKPTVAALQQAVTQERYADARYLADELLQQSLSDEDVATVTSLQEQAGNALARLNLIEAIACQQNADEEQAAIHFELALEQASSIELQKEIEQERRLKVTAVLKPETETAAGCAGCNPVTTNLQGLPVDDQDDETRLELILTSYPEPVRAAYIQMSDDFKQAFLLSHEGQDEEALSLFDQLTDDERNFCYWFEVGSLNARRQRYDEASSALKQSLQDNPEPSLALEALVDVLLQTDQASAAQEVIEHHLDQAGDVPFCHSQLATIAVHRGEWEVAAQKAQAALAAGYRQSSFIPLAASIFERNMRLSEAENLLKSLPAGGCKGTMHPLLAEFYLRHGREAEKVFACFNAVSKQEPDNPRWQLRLAQSCLERGWIKEGTAMLQKLKSLPELHRSLQAEVESSIEKYNLSVEQ